MNLKSIVNALCLQTNQVCAKRSLSQAQDMQKDGNKGTLHLKDNIRLSEK